MTSTLLQWLAAIGLVIMKIEACDITMSELTLEQYRLMVFNFDGRFLDGNNIYRVAGAQRFYCVVAPYYDMDMSKEEQQERLNQIRKEWEAKGEEE